MASSGSFKTSDYKGRYLVFSWQETSQSITDNKTVISWTLKSEGDSEWRYYKAGNFKVVIDGATVYQTSQDDRITISENTTIASGTYTFTHNTDGTRSFSASAQGGIYTYAVNCTGSGSFTLDTIPRTSKPTLSASTIELGKPLTIYTNRASSAFTHKLYYMWYTGVWNEIASNVGTSYTWTPPLDFANNIPDATKGLGTIRCVTYNGSTEIGAEEVRFYGAVPASMVPDCSIQVLDATSTKDTYGDFVKGLSKLYVKTTATISYNSPIVSYIVQANGERYTAAEITTGVLTAAGTITVQATVTDKRGRTSTAEAASFPVLDYERPVISALTVHRCNADGSENDQGEYVQAVFSAAITALNNKNSATYKLRYKTSTATSWTEITLAELGGVYTVTDYSHIFDADSSNSYDVEIVATDDIGSVSRSTSASTAFTLMNWHPSGTGLAIGKVSEKQYTAEFAFDIYDKYGTIVSNGAASYTGYGDAGIDPDTTLEHLILTNKNTPNGGFMYIYTSFYAQKEASANRAQFAIPYDSNGSMYHRYYSSGEWSTWNRHMTADEVYPVNSIYISYSNTSPAELFGGTWHRMENRFLWGCPSTSEIGLTAGEMTHTLTTSEIPSHTHLIYDNSASGSIGAHVWPTTWKTNADAGSMKGSSIGWTGDGGAHNNMPPYVNVAIWRRTA